MRRILCAGLLCLLLLTGCASGRTYSVTYLTVFDTVTTVTAASGSEAEFEAAAQAIYDTLWDYHRLFDIYHDYSGINNLKTVNDQAGIAPVPVDSRLLEFLKDCREYYILTGGRVNAAMGSVLKLWHDAREKGLSSPEAAALPDPSALREASAHCDWEQVILDEEKSTVYLADSQMSLDVGAIAKGWAAQKAAQAAPAGYLISVGGNICATGPKDPAGTPWVIGIADPDGGSGYLLTATISTGAMVTSGDYQRCYTVDGISYHHIIDPDTLMPAAYWRSVTVCCKDSALADALSTALFLLPQAEGQQLLDTCGACAMWVDAEGNLFQSPGFSELLNTK